MQKVGTFNSTGKRYTGHYSIWTINELQELLAFLQVGLNNPVFLTNWVNGNLYQATKEVTGVLPVPDDIRNSAGMAPYNALVDSKRQHSHLASLQGTRKAILPISSDAEKGLFREFMQSPETSFGNFSSTAVVQRSVQLWNSKAHGEEKIFYKVFHRLQCMARLFTMIIAA
jgi:hypothetical protein